MNYLGLPITDGARMYGLAWDASRFTIPDRVECRLFYTVKAGRIDIRRLCKKKDY